MSTKRIANTPSPSKRRRLPLGALAALLLLALSGLLLFAACGGDDEETTATPSGTQAPAAEATESPAAEATQIPEATPEPSGAKIDPCALVTKEEAEDIVGESLGDPVVTNTQMLSSCLYSTSDMESVGVDVLTYANEEDAESGFQLAIDINNYPLIEGIGDGAYNSRPIGDITVLKGKYELSIDVANVSTSEDEFETAKDLAATAVDRLP